MDEIKLEESCGSRSFYISLQRQEEAIASLGKKSQPSRQFVSKDHSTYVHFGLELQRHWAAVQITICPFSLPGFLGQTFYSCQLRYTLCCQSCQVSATGPSINLISTAAQRIYDIFYQPSQWNFSVESCYICDSVGLEPSFDELACAKTVEGNLLEYLRIANNSLGTDDSASRRKRRRLNVSGDLVFRGSGNEETEGSGDDDDSGDTDNSVDDEDNGVVEAGGDGDNEVVGPAAQSKDTSEEKEQRTITNLTKKIRKGIEEKVITTKKMRKGNDSQIQVGQTGVVISESDTWLANDKSRGEGIWVAFENWLWTQAHSMVKDSKEMAWKYLFIFSCLRNLRDADIGPIPLTGQESQKMWRWTRAARVVNSIVDGLWLSWGPAAVFVYEALAVKNYALTEVSSLSGSRQQEVVAAVVRNLSEGPTLDLPPDSLVFHPAGCIAAALKYNYQKVCRDLGLSAFALLGPTEIRDVRARMSSLSDQWRAVSLTEMTCWRDKKSHEKRLSSTSPFEILNTVAVTEINSSSSETAPVESVPDLASPARQLHDRTASPGPSRLPAVFVGVSAVDNAADQEQLIRKDLMPQARSPCIDLAASWDIHKFPGWLDLEDCPLFSAEHHFD